MTPPATPVDQESFSALARVDSQDSSFSSPLREYLSSRGTRVVENYESAISARYHVICGDSQFVKTILTKFGKQSDRTLVISWDESTKTNPKIREPHVGLILTDRDTISQDKLTLIFQFFFTAASSFLDMREGRKDTQRIADLIDNIYETKKIHAPRPKIPARWRGKLLVLLFILPLFWYVATMAVSISSYIMSGILITRGDTTAAGKISQLGVSSARAGRFLMDVSASPFIFTGVPTALTRQEQLFGLLIDTGRAISHMSRLSAEAKQWSTNVIVGQGPNQTHQLVVADSLRSGVDGLIIELGLIEASFNQLLSERTFPLALLSLGHTDDMIHTKLALLRTVFGTINKLLLLYKEGGGFSGTQSYLVLFQNSMELRPTGGFVGSVGKLTMVDGLVADFTIFDVYELDGQLRGHVDPPDPIRTLLSQEHWYLRDSNWDPDFFESGQRAAWFYEKETGQSVDGVIAVTTAFVTELLRASGPIVLSDYNDRITSDNFLGKALYYTKSDFFPGSTQKKDFLGSLARGIFERLQDENFKTTVAFGGLVESVGRRDVQFYFVRDNLQKAVKQYGWAGELEIKPSCGDAVDAQGCTDLPIAIVDSNMAVNKANFFITNEISRDIEIGDNGQLEEAVSFSQHNTGEEYKSYTRFYLPSEVSVGRVTIDGGLVGERRGESLPYWEENNEHERVVVGVASVLAAKKNRRITVTYTRPISLSSNSKLLLTTRVQAGTSSMPFSLRVHAPSSWLMTLFNDGEQAQLVASAGLLEYNRSLSSDVGLLLHFSQ